MQFLNERRPSHDLTYSDVFLAPGYTDIGSRMQVDLTTPDGIGTTIPVVVANMTAVAGRRMAETVARRGGITVFPQDIPAEAIADMTSSVKRSHLVFDTPITLHPSDRIVNALDLIHKRSHGAVIVVDYAHRPVGIFTEIDGEGWDRFTPLEEVMSSHTIALSDKLQPEELFDKLSERRVHLAPVIDDDGRLSGVITEKGALRTTQYRPALDGTGRLLVAAAVGVNGDVAAKTRTLMEVGVDVIVVDTAHGHQQKMVEALAAVRSVNDELPVGRPQFSAVLDCAATARAAGKHVWADGGVRHPRDVALAIAAGAASVMVGSWFAGTFESAADTMRDSNGQLYKENYGMASRRAVTFRSRGETPFERARKEMFEEGISQSRMYLDPKTPSVEDIIDRIVTGIRSASTYVGATTIDEFHERAIVGVQSLTGYTEGQPTRESW
jgi:IMP dehydrogenase